MCAKQVYAEEWRARAAMHSTRRRSTDLIAVYFCVCCNGWHLGHPPLSRHLSEDRKKQRRR